MSFSHAKTDEALQEVLTKLDHLNLRGRVFDIDPSKFKSSGFSDVHRAKLKKTDGSVIEIAVKRDRAALNTNPVLAKVRG